MKAEARIKNEPQKMVPPEVPATVRSFEDPFAEDLFATHKSSEGDATGAAGHIGRPQVGISKSWHWRLPQVTSDELEASVALAALPAEFHASVSDSATAILSRYALSPREEISVALIEFQEAHFPSTLASHGAPRVSASFVCEPGRTRFSIEVDARFAIRLVDRLLGGCGDGPNSLRPLTTAELAVVEFLFLLLANAVNKKLDAPLIRLESVGERLSWLNGLPGGSDRADTSDLRRHGLTAAWRIDVGPMTVMAHAYFSGQSLENINRAQEQLRGAGASRDSRYAEAKVSRYASVVPDVPLHIIVGTTDLSAAEFSLLECGDVMLVERPDLVWRAGVFVGALRVRVADGEAALILGEASDPKPSTIKLNVGLVTIGESRALGEKMNMPEESAAEEAVPEELDAIVNGIDGVMLTVRVELATRRLRLDELARLRANQVLDLGCQATDPVDLVVDGRQVARGELVDIEGRLGVRIKQVSTQSP